MGTAENMVLFELSNAQVSFIIIGNGCLLQDKGTATQLHLPFIDTQDMALLWTM